ncbi:UPF0598 protein C8orf82-like protein [Pseudohyphozyma bogoriensis]|nr:UPF0598 protein C8orf82-like protein [Pseudohyphozyma bogoriensis]
MRRLAATPLPSHPSSKFTRLSPSVTRCCRCRPALNTSRRAFATSQPAPSPPTREYFYEVDHTGGLYLSGTKVRNFTSCYKDPAFLDFFYKRLRLNDSDEEDANRYRKEGYEFVSPCGPEVNYVKPDDSALVFQKLVPQGLTYAGTLIEPFQPSTLLVDPDSGYLYHPSPRQKSRRSSATSPTTSQYGEYSLLRSSLVLEAFASSLRMEDERGGSFEWEGKTWEIGVIKPGQVLKRQKW